jgi:DNA-binding transcriptional LysR family regulator
VESAVSRPAARKIGFSSIHKIRIKLKILFRIFEMRPPGTPSVDQLLVLLTVVEEGSFTGAAKRLRRATSAISYAVDTLEAQLGVPLFDRGTTRKPKLTHVGEAVVAEAKTVAYSVDTLRARVRGLLEGLEPEVSLVVDSMFPSVQLAAVLRDFHTTFPTVPVRLLVRTLGAVEPVIRSGDATIGVGCVIHIDPAGLRQIQMPGVQLIPVAAAGHPLALAAGASPDLREHLHLVLSEQLAAEGREYSVLSLKTWRIGDMAARYQLILAGVGWGGLPEPMVRSDIETGKLVRLDLGDWRGGEYPLHVMHKVDTPPGPAGRWLIERLLASSAGAGAHTVPEAAAPTNVKSRRRASRRVARGRTK